MVTANPIFKRGTTIRLMNVDKAITRVLNKAVEWPPNPGLPGGECPAGSPAAANPYYDPNTKGMAAVSVAGAAWVGINTFATHAAFMAAACAAGNEAGFIDMVYRKSIPGSDWCEGIVDCDEVNIFQAADFYFDLRPAVIIPANGTVRWGVDASRGNLHPFAGEIVTDGSGFQITKRCCASGCAAAHGVWGRIDFTKASCPPPAAT